MREGGTNNDAGDMRVIKRAVDESANESHTLYIFPGYELRRTDFTAGEYTADENTEVMGQLPLAVARVREALRPR